MLLRIGEIVHDAFPFQMTREALAAAACLVRTGFGDATRRVIVIGVLRLRRFSLCLPSLPGRREQGQLVC
jgi:hypothetical protein